MATAPLSIRIILSALLLICGTVVLGISIHVENAARSIGFKSHTFTFDAFVGAYTLAAELGFILLRLVMTNSRFVSLSAELGLAAISWIFWIASGIDTTLFTEDSRSVCRNLDDLFDLPEFEGADPEVISVVHSALKSACSELHAELAFIWIGFVVSTILLGWTALLAYRLRRRGGHMISNTSLKTYDQATHSHDDPFHDRAGTLSGPSVGVVQELGEEEDPDRKP